MATVMENCGGGSFGDWDYEQFDEAAVGDENLSMDVDEFLGLLDENPDPVKGSLENASLMYVLTSTSSPPDIILEALGAAVALEVEGKAGVAAAAEEDGGGLEGPGCSRDAARRGGGGKEREKRVSPLWVVKDLLE